MTLQEAPVVALALAVAAGCSSTACCFSLAFNSFWLPLPLALLQAPHSNCRLSIWTGPPKRSLARL